jgi:type IV secretory pathway VirB2 component (pilin)
MAQLAKPGIGHNFAPALASVKREADYEDDGLLAVAGPIILLCYAGSLAIATVTFFGTGEALYAVVISIAFALIYFAIPLLMGRARAARDERWHTDKMHRISAIVDVWTGPIHRWEAIAQIVSVPIAVLFGFTSFAVIWSFLSA